MQATLNPDNATPDTLLHNARVLPLMTEWAANIQACDPFEAKYYYINRGYFEIVRLYAQNYPGSGVGQGIDMARQIHATYQRLHGLA